MLSMRVCMCACIYMHVHEACLACAALACMCNIHMINSSVDPKSCAGVYLLVGYPNFVLCTGTYGHGCKFLWCFVVLADLEFKYCLSVHQVVTACTGVVKPFLCG